MDLASTASARAPHDAGATPTVPITIVIPTLDEAERIGGLLADLRWAGEILVVDGGSHDATPEIARASGARVLGVAGRTIAEQRNAGIADARHEWILTMDADERVSPQLRSSLARLVADPSAAHAAYRVRSRNWYLGRELRHGPWGRDWKTRVFTRDQRYAVTLVHENLQSPGPLGVLAGELLHTPYRDVAHHASKVVTYARWGARDLHARGRRARASDLVVRPAWRFVRDYVVWSGWRDGVPGLIVSVISAFAAFLKYACLWGLTGQAPRT